MILLGRLEEIGRKAAAATPGPWERCGDVDCDGDGEFSCWHTFDRQAEILPPLGESGPVAICSQQEHDNATFIVAARTDVPALVAALQEAVGALETIRGFGDGGMPPTMERFVMGALAAIARHLEGQR